jgi:hypothetical protein
MGIEQLPKQVLDVFDEAIEKNLLPEIAGKNAPSIMFCELASRIESRTMTKEEFIRWATVLDGYSKLFMRILEE